MNDDIFLTIITPTYNRKKTLMRLFKSLCKQSMKNFQWLVIDDGSIDRSNDLFSNLNSKGFLTEYYYKENGGKHTALNYSHPYIKGELVLIVDSDDYLKEDAVEIIYKCWQKFSCDSSICGMSFLKGFSDGNYLSIKLPHSYEVLNHIDFRVNNTKSNGDRCEVIRTSLFIEYKFPEYEGERFISEDMLWNRVGYKYNTVYCNDVIYICEYLDGGLTKSGRKLRLQSPNLMALVTKTYFNDRTKLLIKMKRTLLYICYSYFAKKKTKDIIKESGQAFLTVSQLPFGFLLYLYWKKKYFE